MRVSNSELTKVAPEIIEWLDYVVEKLNDGTIDTLKPAPFYARRELITEEIIDQVLQAFDAYLQSEIDNYATYHYNAQGVNRDTTTLIPPGFALMPPAAKRATVERYDELMQTTRADGPIPPPTEWGAE